MTKTQIMARRVGIRLSILKLKATDGVFQTQIAERAGISKTLLSHILSPNRPRAFLRNYVRIEEAIASFKS